MVSHLPWIESSTVSTDTNPQTTRGRSYAPRHTRGKKGKPKKGFFRRFWWVFLAVPVLVVLAVGGALVYAYSQIELPKALPPIQSTYHVRPQRLPARVDPRGGRPDDHPVRSDARVAPRRRDRRRGPRLLPTPGHRPGRHPPRRLDRPGQAPDRPGRLDDHRSSSSSRCTRGATSSSRTARQEYVVPPRTIKEKIREALLAIKLEQTLTKDQILARYLNTIYLGHGAYGVQAAAQTYWGIDAADLTVQAVGDARRPHHVAEPVRPDRSSRGLEGPARLRARPDGALRLPRARRRPISSRRRRCTTDPKKEVVNAPANSEYFVDYAKRYLINKYGGAAVFGGGYRVTTSLDLGLQRAAEAAVNAHLPSPSDPEGALVAIDPKTGQILAMVGGRGFSESQVNLAVSGLRLKTETFGGTGRQAGSSFKAFTLAAAMKAGYNLNAYWQGPGTITIPNTDCYTNGGAVELSNASDSEAGTFTLQAATALLRQHRLRPGGRPARPGEGRRHGAPAGHPQPPGPGLLDHARRRGREPARDDERVRDARRARRASLGGPARAAHEPQRQGDRRRERQAEAGPGRERRRPGHVRVGGRRQLRDRNGRAVSPIVRRPGKTGTAQDYVDAWFCGYTPQLATCVWVGYPQGEIPLDSVEGVSPVFGGTIPAAIWHDFMTVAMQGKPVETFAVPSLRRPHDRARRRRCRRPRRVPTPTPSHSTQARAHGSDRSDGGRPGPAPPARPDRRGPGPTGPTGPVGGPSGRPARSGCVVDAELAARRRDVDRQGRDDRRAAPGRRSHHERPARQLHPLAHRCEPDAAHLQELARASVVEAHAVVHDLDPELDLVELDARPSRARPASAWRRSKAPPAPRGRRASPGRRGSRCRPFPANSVRTPCSVPKRASVSRIAGISPRSSSSGGRRPDISPRRPSASSASSLRILVRISIPRSVSPALIIRSAASRESDAADTPCTGPSWRSRAIRLRSVSIGAVRPPEQPRPVFVAVLQELEERTDRLVGDPSGRDVAHEQDASRGRHGHLGDARLQVERLPLRPLDGALAGRGERRERRRRLRSPTRRARSRAAPRWRLGRCAPCRRTRRSHAGSRPMVQLDDAVDGRFEDQPKVFLGLRGAFRSSRARVRAQGPPPTAHAPCPPARAVPRRGPACCGSGSPGCAPRRPAPAPR